MPKAINSHLSSRFHGIINNFLERNSINIIKQDIDSGIFNTNTEKPFGLIEIKRSKFIERWEPYAQDRNNYEALYKLGKLLRIKTVVVFYEKDNIKDKGFKLFEMTGGFNFESKGIFPLRQFKKKMLDIFNIESNPNKLREYMLQGLDQNIYYYLKLISNFGYSFYSEDNGWWMLVSSPNDFKPLFMYKEMIEDTCNLTLFDKGIINACESISIPCFRFCFTGQDVIFYQDDNRKTLTLDDFLLTYSSYC